MLGSKKSVLVSGMGLATELVSRTVKLGRTAGLTDEELYVLGTDEGQPFIRAMVDALKGSMKVNFDGDVDVSVNYGETLEQKVERLRKLGLTFANDSITSVNFPVPEGRSGTVQMRLALPKPGRYMSTGDAQQFVEGCSLEIGDPYQLLDFIIQYWDRLQPLMTEGLWIVALAVSWQRPDGHRCVVCLGCYGSDRGLSLGRVRDGWDGRWRFLGSRSVPSNA